MVDFEAVCSSFLLKVTSFFLSLYPQKEQRKVERKVERKVSLTAQQMEMKKEQLTELR